MADCRPRDDQVEEAGDAVPLPKVLVEVLDLLLVPLCLLRLVLDVVPEEWQRKESSTVPSSHRLPDILLSNGQYINPVWPFSAPL